jgi:hypothetical protein
VIGLLLAFIFASNVGLTEAFSIDIAPETLNVYNTNANYLTAYIEQSVLFEDHFSDPAWTADNWQNLGGGTWYVENGQYYGEGLYDTRSISLAGSMFSPVDAYNFVLDVKVTNLVFGSYGVSAHIAFRYLDDGHTGAIQFC